MVSNYLSAVFSTRYVDADSDDLRHAKIKAGARFSPQTGMPPSRSQGMGAFSSDHDDSSPKAFWYNRIRYGK
jgi:hypothetical protein